MEFGVAVLLGRMTRDRFSPVRVRPRGSWTLFIQICVDRCLLILSVGFHTFTFIDDYSRKTWIYFLKTKEFDEVLDRFKEFKALVENQTGKRIRVLRSNNGGEYT